MNKADLAKFFADQMTLAVCGELPSELSDAAIAIQGHELVRKLKYDLQVRKIRRALTSTASIGAMEQAQ